MPILAGLVSSFFGMVASLLAARVSIGVAAAGAFLVTAAAGFAAVKAALWACAAALSAVAAPSIVSSLSYVVPSNLAACLTAMIFADTIFYTWDYWRQTLGVAIQLAKG